jgi:hypothetical protein
MSVTRLKSPTQAVAGSLDSKLFTASVREDQRTEASSPLTLVGASPRKSWFSFFSRGSPMKPLSKTEQAPLARAVVTEMSSEEVWAKAQPVLEEMDIGMRYSKTLRSLKAAYPGGTNSNAPITPTSKFLIRMSNLLTPRGSNSTYLHFEYRSGSQEEFLALFDKFCELTKSIISQVLVEEPESPRVASPRSSLRESGTTAAVSPRGSLRDSNGSGTSGSAE